MYRRKLDYSGRINLPKELCDIFHLKKDDLIDITHNKTHILIKKHQPEFVCVVTGKIAKKGINVGNAFFSKEGLQKIKDEIKRNDL